MKERSIEECSSVITLHKEGLSESCISSRLNIPKSTVHITITRSKKSGTLLNQPRSRRPKSTTKAQDKFIYLTSLRDRRLTAPQIRQEMGNAKLANSLYQRWNGNWGMKGCVAVKKPLLRKANIAKWLKWTKDHKKWTPEQWKSMLWTDESKFEFWYKEESFCSLTVSRKVCRWVCCTNC